MNYAGDAIHSVDMWGTTIRRFRFKSGEDHNNLVHKLTNNFVNDISKNSSALDRFNSHVYEDVSHKMVKEFIRDLNMIPDDYGDEALFNQLDELQNEEIPNFKVGIFNKKT